MVDPYPSCVESQNLLCKHVRATSAVFYFDLGFIPEGETIVSVTADTTDPELVSSVSAWVGVYSTTPSVLYAIVPAPLPSAADFFFTRTVTPAVCTAPSDIWTTAPIATGSGDAEFRG